MHADPQIAASRVSEPLIEAMLDLAGRLAWSDLPRATRHELKRELLDYIGGMVAGRAVVGLPGWLDVLIGQGGRAEAHVMGGAAVPATTAALCNGYYGHVLELDDTHENAQMHAGSATLPALFALAERNGPTSGERLCMASLLAIELTARIGISTRLNLAHSGWIFGSLFGHFGAAFGGAYLAGLDAETTRNAVGIAYTQDSGNHQSTVESAPTKHVQPGYAAMHGVLATLMAGGGLTGVHQPITGEDGLARVFLRGEYDPAAAIEGIGTRFEVDRLSCKPYPSCRYTHSAVGAALRLRERLGADVAKIEAIEIAMQPGAFNVVGRDSPTRFHPTRRMEAQFSVQGCVAVALLYGAPTVTHLLEMVPPTAAVAAMMARIRARPDPDDKSRGAGTATVSVRGPFGTLKEFERVAPGHPDNPLDDAALIAKFTGNAALCGIGAAEAAELGTALLDIDALTDVRPLLACIAASCRGMNATP